MRDSVLDLPHFAGVCRRAVARFADPAQLVRPDVASLHEASRLDWLARTWGVRVEVASRPGEG